MRLPKWFKGAKVCLQCGEQFLPESWQGKNRIYSETEKRYSKKKFCNNTCRSLALSELKPEDNYFYGKHLEPWNKDKRTVKRYQLNGYWRIRDENDQWDYEHRIVARNKFGDISNKVVHHKNGNRLDNSPENIELFDTHLEHLNYHRKTGIRSHGS